jgi:hypothetical protein
MKLELSPTCWNKCPNTGLLQEHGPANIGRISCIGCTTDARGEYICRVTVNGSEVVEGSNSPPESAVATNASEVKISGFKRSWPRPKDALGRII